MSRPPVASSPQKPPPIQTKSLDLQRSAANNSGSSSGNSNPTPPVQRPRTPSNTFRETAQRIPDDGQQRLVLADPIAFRYLEDDPCTTVLEPRVELHGYECYVVEQWTTSRTHPTFLITTYTGDPTHVVIVGVLGVPADESSWSTKLRVYFKALNHFHASRKQTELGTLMATNLSSFPSTLTVIPVPNGDIRKHRFDFTVNENLKRLGCSGRVGLTLAPPAAATIAKFHQIYHTSDKNDIYRSVTELVKLCQSALTLFDNLVVDYADGLLCDMTERAINGWWSEFGSEQYNIEPHDGILGPTTVAGLLGLFMGARNRLHEVNAPVAKDAFDLEAMKRGISHFQKQQRLTRTRRLDRRTLDRLHKVTQKAAHSEGSMLPRAVKSTVAELSGKGGEMVMDAVGRRGKAGIADIETCDIERFLHLAYGEKPRWLWQGRPLKKSKNTTRGTSPASEPTFNYLKFESDHHGGFAWTGRKSIADGTSAVPVKRPSHKDFVSPVAESPNESGDEDPRFKSLTKRTSGLKQDAINGIGKLKGAVGLKGHGHQRHSLEESPGTPDEGQTVKSRRPFFLRSQTSPLSSPDTSPRLKPHDRAIDAEIAEQRKRVLTDPEHSSPKFTGYMISYPEREEESNGLADEHISPIDKALPQFTSVASPERQAAAAQEDAAHSTTDTAHDTESLYNEIFIAKLDTADADVRLLRRAASSSRHVTANVQSHRHERYPRHLSFSVAEESILTWRDLTAPPTRPVSPSGRSRHPLDFEAQLAEQKLAATAAKQLRSTIDILETDTAAWTRSQLEALQNLLPQIADDQARLDGLYRPHSERYQELQAAIEGLLREHKERLEKGGTEIETLAAKLDYEIAGFKSRIEDVEVGVGDFEKDVLRLEERVNELEAQGDVGRTCVVQ